MLRSISPPYFKWNLTMKLTTILLLVSLFKIQASTYSQNTKISLELKDVSVEEVLNKIEKATEFNFLVNIAEIDIDRLVTVDVKKKTIAFILDQLFENTKVTYEVYGKQVILKLDPTIKIKSGPDPEPEKEKDTPKLVEITGLVTDTNGDPLPGGKYPRRRN